MADISKINIGGQDYNIKDTSARTDIASIQTAIKGGIHFAGKVTQEVTDKAEVSKTSLTLIAAETPGGIHVDTFHTGDIIIDAKNREFINDGTYWHEIGRGDEFGSFAFVNTGSVTTSNHTHKYKKTSITHAVSGTVTSTGTIVPQGGLTIYKINTTDTTDTNSNFTPEGTISKPNITVSPSTTSFVTSYAGSFGKLTTEIRKKIDSITDYTASKLSSDNLSYCTVDGETLKITAVTASNVNCSLVSASDAYYATGAIESATASDTNIVMVGLGAKSTTKAITKITAALDATPTFTGDDYNFIWSGSNTSVTVTGNANQVKIDKHTETDTDTTSNGGQTLTVSPVAKV